MLSGAADALHDVLQAQTRERESERALEKAARKGVRKQVVGRAGTRAWDMPDEMEKKRNSGGREIDSLPPPQKSNVVLGALRAPCGEGRTRTRARREQIR